MDLNHKKVKLPKINPNQDVVISSVDEDPMLLIRNGLGHPLWMGIRIEDQNGNNITNDFNAGQIVQLDDNNALITIKAKGEN